MYSISIRPSAVKELRKISASDRKKIATAIDELAKHPRPHGAKKLAGVAAWRIRVGNYRIVYTVEDQHLFIEVIRIAHRRDVYR